MDEIQNQIIQEIQDVYSHSDELEEVALESSGAETGTAESEQDREPSPVSQDREPSPVSAAPEADNANDLWNEATGEGLEYTEADAELVRLQNKWGPGPDNHEYNEKAYNRLEEIYNAYAAEWPDRGKQTELSLMKICRLTLEQERAFNARNWDSMKAIQALIKAELDVEAARKKEAAMRESIRIDDIVSAVEKAGLHMMDYDELCSELANHALHHTYPYTRDAADRMLLLIRNATAWNEGQPEIAELPTELKMTDPLNEFAAVADSTETKLMNEL